MQLLPFLESSGMEDNNLKFVVHGIKERYNFILEGITNYILQNLVY